MLNKVFGDYLKELRKAKDKTLEEVAKQLNVSLSFLCDIEKKRRPPLRQEQIEKLTIFLSLTQEEKEKLYDLKAQHEQNTPADVQEVILSNEASSFVRLALRMTKNNQISKEEWEEFVNKNKEKTADSEKA